MNAFCAVAHPDDCVIFARPYIDNYPDYKWTIVYLTYQSTDPRAQEVSKYWNARNVSTVFLGFKDHYKDLETNQLNFWTREEAINKIKLACKDANLILTHNKDGDYGHIHHKLVHTAISSLDIPKVYFASSFNYNKKYTAKEDLQLDQFPLHREVIGGFSDLNVGLYTE